MAIGQRMEVLFLLAFPRGIRTVSTAVTAKQAHAPKNPLLTRDRTRPRHRVLPGAAWVLREHTAQTFRSAPRATASRHAAWRRNASNAAFATVFMRRMLHAVTDPLQAAGSSLEFVPGTKRVRQPLAGAPSPMPRARKHGLSDAQTTETYRRTAGR